MERKQDKKTFGILVTLIAGVCWGFSGACGQFLFDYKNATSNWLVPIRLLTAGAAVLLYLLLRNPKKVLEPWKNKKDAFDFIIFSIFGMTLCQYSYFRAIQYSNAGVATVLQYTGPALILIYVCFRSRRNPRAYEIAALILSLSGTFVLATHGDISSMALSGQAIAWGAMASLTLAVYSVQPERIIKKYGSLLPIGWAMFLGGLLMNVVFRPWTAVHVIIDTETILALIGVVLFGTIIAFSLYLQGMNLIGPTDAAMISCVEPIAAVLFSFFWLGEAFLPIDFFGMALTIGAVLFISLFKEKEPSEVVLSPEQSAPKFPKGFDPGNADNGRVRKGNPDCE